MYDELIKSLRVCGHLQSVDDTCVAFHDGCCEAEPVCMYELMEKAADAIEELSQKVEDYETRLELTPEAQYAIDKHADDLIDRMDKLIKGLDEKPRWIPVTERLPEAFENVLVANKRGKHYDIDKGWWNGTFFDRCAKGGYRNVTHWMSLPQPPKEET